MRTPLWSAPAVSGRPDAAPTDATPGGTAEAAGNATGAPGGTAAGGVPGAVVDADTAVLVGRMRRGLLVSDLWYTRVLDPRTLVVTGLTRNGVWLIEDGVITRPVQNFRFTQSYPQALGPGTVLAVGARAASIPIGWNVMAYRAPALRLASWNFTGNASG